MTPDGFLAYLPWHSADCASTTLRSKQTLQSFQRHAVGSSDIRVSLFRPTLLIAVIVQPDPLGSTRRAAKLAAGSADLKCSAFSAVVSLLQLRVRLEIRGGGVETIRVIIEEGDCAVAAVTQKTTNLSTPMIVIDMKML